MRLWQRRAAASEYAARDERSWEATLRLLLTSGGVTNGAIAGALVELLGKPIAEAGAICIPTASYPHLGGPLHAYNFVAGEEPRGPMCELGWRWLGLMELTALESIGEDNWVTWLAATDALVVNGGDPLFLHHWLVRSGFADRLDGLGDTVWVGMSASSMVLSPRIGPEFVGWRPPDGADDRTLGLVDFAVFPHLDNPDMPLNSLAEAEKWAAGLDCPAYAIDDQTALKVIDGEVEVVSEGHWKLFND